MGALLLQACGLPGILPNLGAPVNTGTPSSSNSFSFENGTQTAPDDFYGFEIYYKFYDDSSGSGSTQYYSDDSQLSATATGPTQLTNLGYERAYLLPPGYQEGTAITQPATPLIPITTTSLKTTAFQVTIDFSSAFPNGVNQYPEVDLNGSPIVVQNGAQTGTVRIARYFAVTDSPFSAGPYILEGFGNNDFAADQGTANGAVIPGDLPASVITAVQASSPVSLVLGLYAIAYGLVNFTTPVYSPPTALGYIKYNFPVFPTSYSNPSPP